MKSEFQSAVELPIQTRSCASQSLANTFMQPFKSFKEHLENLLTTKTSAW